MAEYYPKKGDFVSLNFNPQSGHEQKGRRPALIVSNSLFNKHTGMALACPITSTDRGNPFHVNIEKTSKVMGVIMLDQVKSIDYKSRKVKFIEKSSKEIMEESLGKLTAIFS